MEGWSPSFQSIQSLAPQQKKAIKHHVMGCLEDGYPDMILLYHGTNDLRSEESVERIASNINPALSAKNKRNTIWCFKMTVRNNKYDRKGKEANVILKKKCNDKNLTFVDNGNKNTRMLNKSGLHLNENDITQLVNNSYYHMKKWRYKISMGNDSRRKKTNLGSKKVTLTDL